MKSRLLALIIMAVGVLILASGTGLFSLSTESQYGYAFDVNDANNGYYVDPGHIFVYNPIVGATVKLTLADGTVVNGTTDSAGYCEFQVSESAVSARVFADGYKHVDVAEVVGWNNVMMEQGSDSVLPPSDNGTVPIGPSAIVAKMNFVELGVGSVFVICGLWLFRKPDENVTLEGV
jgi:hypothetical protein